MKADVIAPNMAWGAGQVPGDSCCVKATLQCTWIPPASQPSQPLPAGTDWRGARSVLFPDPRSASLNLEGRAQAALSLKVPRFASTEHDTRRTAGEDFGEPKSSVRVHNIDSKGRNRTWLDEEVVPLGQQTAQSPHSFESKHCHRSHGNGNLHSQCGSGAPNRSSPTSRSTPSQDTLYRVATKHGGSLDQTLDHLPHFRVALRVSSVTFESCAPSGWTTRKVDREGDVYPGPEFELGPCLSSPRRHDTDQPLGWHRPFLSTSHSHLEIFLLLIEK